MTRNAEASSEELEFWHSTKRLREAEEQIKKDFERRSAEAIRQALGNRANQL
jgi:hypothetical protein